MVSVPGVLARGSSTKVFVGNSAKGVFERDSTMAGAVFDRESATGVLGRASEVVGVFGRVSVVEGALGRDSAGTAAHPPIFWDGGREGGGEVGATLSSERPPWGVL